MPKPHISARNGASSRRLDEAAVQAEMWGFGIRVLELWTVTSQPAMVAGAADAPADRQHDRVPHQTGGQLHGEPPTVAETTRSELPRASSRSDPCAGHWPSVRGWPRSALR